MKKSIFCYLMLAMCFLYNTSVTAQCAMCKYPLENDLANGNSNTMASGLNTGILYLMAIPYIILMLGGYFFFKKQIDAKVKGWRNKYFPAKQMNG
jgi:hypothetical protein